MEHVFRISRRSLENSRSACDPVIKPIPDRTVVLTFDDASRDHLERVAPLFREYGFEATFFVIDPDYPMAPPPEGAMPPPGDKMPKQASKMTWDDMKKLSDMGFDIGHHTRSNRFDGRAAFDADAFGRDIDELNDLLA